MFVNIFVDIGIFVKIMFDIFDLFIGDFDLIMDELIINVVFEDVWVGYIKYIEFGGDVEFIDVICGYFSCNYDLFFECS